MAGVTRFPIHLCSLRSGLTYQNAKAKERKEKIEKELSLSEGSIMLLARKTEVAQEGGG